jgi:phosphoserine aminotransferase
MQKGRGCHLAAHENRVDNFGPGPAALPLPVLQKVQEEILNFQGTGMSMLELSHRNAKYEEVQLRGETLLREQLGISDEYSVLFLQGGASLQFSMLPLNFLKANKRAGYIVTGSFAEKAFVEAQNIGNAVAVGSTKEEKYCRIPSENELCTLDVDAYIHLTSNNTIYGTQWQTFPGVQGIPLVADMSSDILSRQFDVNQFSLIYAGAQKNLGAAGVTVVIVKKSWLQESAASIPTMLRYAVHEKQASRYNTPPTFAVYVLSLVLEWVKNNGGLVEMEKQNHEKANLLYQVIDSYPDFYSGHAEKGSRSSMNVTFRLPSDEATKRLIAEAKERGITGIGGHRSVGGCRVSLYNGVSLASVERFVDFLEEFYHQSK